MTEKYANDERRRGWPSQPGESSRVLQLAPRPALLLCLALGPACDQPLEHRERAWPEGTALAVGNVAITGEEIDAVAEGFRRIEPESSDTRLRRLAVSNFIVPNALARVLAGEEREAARSLALAARAELDPEDPAAEAEHATEWMGFKGLGFATWFAAFDLPTGEWSPVLEEVSGFRLVRVLARTNASRPVDEAFQVEIRDFPYLPPETSYERIQEAYGEERLIIVDPAWREAVPEWIQYKMGAHDPGSNSREDP